MPAAPQKQILVISLAGIGDTIFATPLIRELRLNFPDAQIDALVMWPGSRQILELNPCLDLVHQRNLIREGKSEALRFLWGLRGRKYDITINTMPQSRVDYRLVARLINAPVRISHHYKHVRWLNPLLVNRTIAPDYSAHCVKNNLDLLGCAGARPKLQAHLYELFLPTSEIEWAEDFVSLHKLQGRTIMGMHIGSGGTKNLALRRWPKENWVELIRLLLIERPELVVLLFGGPEEEHHHSLMVKELGSERVFVAETKDIRQAAALLGKCRLFLSVDTSLMHVAAAMKVPNQIVIETPSWNKTVEPFGRPFILVPNPAVAGRNLKLYDYNGRGIRGTREEIIQCMKSVKVEAVLEAVTKLI